MDAEKFLKEHIRMCLWYRGKKEGCALCPRYRCYCLGGNGIIDFFPALDIKEYILMVEEWSKEHPEKTRQQDFLEKFPKAETDDNGMPNFCCAKLGYTCDCSKTDCCECWNTPLEDDE